MATKMTFSDKLNQYVNRAIDGSLNWAKHRAFERTARAEYGYQPNDTLTIQTDVWVIVRYNIDAYSKEWTYAPNGYTDGYFTDVLKITRDTECLAELVFSFGEFWLKGEHNGYHFNISLGNISLNNAYATIIER